MTPKRRGSVTGTLPLGAMLSAPSGSEANSLRHPSAFSNVMSKALHLVNRLSGASHSYGLLLMTNEKKLQLGLQLPVRATGCCPNVVEVLCSSVQYLRTDLEEFACTATDWNGPSLASFCRPVRSDDGSRHQIPPVLEVVKGEPVDRHLVFMYVVDPCEFIVDKCPSQQMTASVQPHGCWATTPLVYAEFVVSRSREPQLRSDSPHKLPRVDRG